MLRIALLILVLLVAAGCQTYTTGLQQSVNRADETVAIAALHNIIQAERSYSVSHEGNYGTLAQLSTDGYLDSRFASNRPLKDYILTMTVSSGGEPGYGCAADPAEGRQGRHFFIDSTSGVIHVNESRTANSSDPAIE